MSSSEDVKLPNCPAGCRNPHTLEVAIVLLGVRRTKLYELMNEGKIRYIDTDYGRRIRHDDIDRYLEERAVG